MTEMHQPRMIPGRMIEVELNDAKETLKLCENPISIHDAELLDTHAAMMLMYVHDSADLCCGELPHSLSDVSQYIRHIHSLATEAGVLDSLPGKFIQAKYDAISRGVSFKSLTEFLQNM